MSYGSAWRRRKIPSIRSVYGKSAPDAEDTWHAGRRMRPVLLLVFLGCAASPAPRATHTTAAPAPRYRVVHIDTLAPEKAASFVDARKAWVAELVRAKTSDGRGTFLQVDERSFYTIRPLARFGELDTRGEEIERALA